MGKKKKQYNHLPNNGINELNSQTRNQRRHLALAIASIKAGTCLDLQATPLHLLARMSWHLLHDEEVILLQSPLQSYRPKGFLT